MGSAEKRDVRRPERVQVAEALHDPGRIFREHTARERPRFEVRRGASQQPGTRGEQLIAATHRDQGWIVNVGDRAAQGQLVGKRRGRGQVCELREFGIGVRAATQANVIERAGKAGIGERGFAEVVAERHAHVGRIRGHVVLTRGRAAVHEQRRGLIAQYHAHVAGEFAVGLVPPKQSAHPHDQLVGVLGVCRDTLSVIAVRAELEELDDETALIGLLAIDATRDAFRGARATSTDLQSWISEAGPAAPWVVPDTPPSTFMTMLMWSLIGVCGVLFLALVAEVFLMGN